MGPDTTGHGVVERRPVLVAAALAVLLAVSYGTLALLLIRGVDLRVYRAGGYSWLHGIPLYSDQFPGLRGTPPLPFTYPPVAAILFVPLSLLPFGPALVLHEVVITAATMLSCLVVARRRFARRRTAVLAAFAVTAVAVAFEPVRETQVFGQVNTVLLLMICVDCLVLPDHRLRWLPRGVLTGLAAAIKLTPAVFVLYFLIRRDWRAAATSVLTFLVVGFGVFLLDPAESRAYWLHALLDTDRIGGLAFSHNQSLQALLYRLGVGGELRSVLWAVGVVAVVALGVVAARRSLRAGDDLGALLAVAAVGLVASPVSWDHHWVWILLAVFPLVSAVRTGRGWTRWGALAVLVLFLLPPHSLMPSMGDVELHWAWWQHLLGNCYLYAAVGLLVYLVARRAPADAQRAEPVSAAAA